jgi:hypothetical protein
MSVPVAFQAPIDIMNRALQRVGQTRIASLTEDSKACDEVTFCYDKLRIAEMRRNIWVFSIRQTALRPYNPPQPVSASNLTATLGTMMLTPAAWSATNNYIPGSIATFNTKTYFSRTANINSEPDINPTDWAQYFGPRTVEPYDTTGKTTYYPGELVYTLSGVTPTVFLALAQTTDAPTTTPTWVSTTYYNLGDTVTGSNSSKYQSKVDLNVGLDPTTDAGVHWATLPVANQPDTHAGQNWLQIDATVKSIQFIYPIGTGPSFQTNTRNVYFLPYGFLRKAPQNPKAGSNTFLGGPSGNQYDDWEFQGQHLLTRQNGVLILRFAADIADVTQMDSMFCEGLSCRIGVEVCEPLTQSVSKIQGIATEYKQFMGEARAVNGIEAGPIEPAEDDFITCRM